MEHSIIIGFIVSLVLTSLVIMFLIQFQRKKALGQIERELGPASHKAKQGTPTLGGIGFILGIGAGVLSYICLSPYTFDYQMIIILFFPFLAYGLLGFYDDYLILKRGKNDGIKAGKKFLCQIIIAAITFYFCLQFGFSTEINLIFISIDAKWIYGIVILFLLSGFTNAANLTDGLDGLLGGLMVISLITFYVIAKWMKISEIPDYIFISLGAIFGFLIFNFNNAKIYMGNTGSLALGALFTSIAIILKLEIFLFIIGIVYVIETASVILQVGYFKLSKGKRIFRMAPFHHHLELRPMKERDCVYLLYFIGVLGAISALLLFFYGGYR